MNNASRVTNNEAGQGGGIFNDTGAAAILNETSRITRNDATLGVGSGGGIFSNGTTTLNDSSIVLNTPDNCSGSVPIAGCTEG
jgi:hypothetical protein